MLVKYKSKKLEKECTDYSKTVKAYGKVMAVRIHQRIDEILAVDSIETLIKSRIGKCHSLTGDREGEYAMVLVQPYRLCFKKDINEVGAALIISIEDYH